MISNLYPPETIGGAEKYVRNVSERLVEEGHEVVVLTTTSTSRSPSRFAQEERNGVTVWRFRPLCVYTPYEHRDAHPWEKPLQHTIDLWNPHSFVSFRRAFKEVSPDIVHTHNFGGLSAAVFAATRVLDAPVVHTLHDYRLLDIRPNLFKDGQNLGIRGLTAPYRWFNQKAIEPFINHVVAPSRFIIEKHQEGGLFRTTPCARVQLGIDTDEELVPIDTNDFRLLYAGQLTIPKGVDLLVKTVQSIDDPNLRLDVLGKGPERDHIESLAATDDRIHVHGFVSEAELRDFYRQADATVVPSRWYDNSPMVIYESYSRGTPVIGARIGGIPELVDEEETGLLFEADDPNALRTAITRAIQAFDQETRTTARQKGRELTLQNHIRELMSLYQDIVHL